MDRLNHMKWIVLLIIAAVYYPLFFSQGTLSSGDWPYVYPEHMRELSVFEPPYIWLEPYYRATAKLGFLLGLSWEILERLFWFLPIVVVCMYGSYRLTKSWIGTLVYTTNTYVIMLIDGGQLGVAMSYAFVPLVAEAFKSVMRAGAKHLFRFSVLFALLCMLDVRVGYIAGILCVLMLGVSILTVRTTSSDRKEMMKHSLVALCIAVFLNAFWLIPLLISGTGILTGSAGGVYTSTDALTYFSVARFPQTLGLLHPNWPENIFGKIYLMNPVFLVLPFIAFAGLLARNSIQKTVAVYTCVGLAGVFLAKGVQDPFGMIYEWLFQYVPGFMMFRDPTKFYVLIALSYSVLISGVMTHISKRVRIAPVLFGVLWLSMIHPVWTGRVDGTFTPQEVPDEYRMLKNVLVSDQSSYATFWIPQRQRFGFSSQTHPSFDATGKLEVDSIDVILDWFELPEAHTQMREWQVRYVIVPYDSEGELFLDGYEYCDRCRTRIVNRLEQRGWLERVDSFTQNAVFEVKDHQQYVYGERDSTNSSVRSGLAITAGTAVCVILMYLFVWKKANAPHS